MADIDTGIKNNTPMSNPEVPAHEFPDGGDVGATTQVPGAEQETIKEANANSVDDILDFIKDLHKQGMDAIDSYKAKVNGAESSGEKMYNKPGATPTPVAPVAKTDTVELNTSNVLTVLEAIEDPMQRIEFYKK